MASNQPEIKTTYKYKPIYQGRITRVLVLLPDKDREAPIRIQLAEQTLPDRDGPPAKYEALSYVWGVNSGYKPIYCGGDTICVTLNCYNALRYLRLPTNPRKLWVDAICIDQASDRERAHQIPLMGDVYACSNKVIVSLGQGDLSIEQVFDALSTLSPTIWKFTKWLPRNTAIKSFRTVDRIHRLAERAVSRHNTVLPASEVLMKDCYPLFNHSWFERAWTLQEFSYGKRVYLMYNTKIIRWEALHLSIIARPHWTEARTINRFNELDECRNYLQKVIDISGVHGVENIPQTLNALFRMVRSRDAQKSHDHVFAYYQLLRDIGINLSPPNYERTVEDLWKEATYCYIKSSKSLLILEHIVGDNRSNLLPSWVPDYASHAIEINNISNWRYLSLKWNEEYIDSSSLATRGKLLDKIVFNCDRMPGFPMETNIESTVEYIHVLYNWFTSILDENLKCASEYEPDKCDLLVSLPSGQFEKLFESTHHRRIASLCLLFIVGRSEYIVVHQGSNTLPNFFIESVHDLVHQLLHSLSMTGQVDEEQLPVDPQDHFAQSFVFQPSRVPELFDYVGLSSQNNVLFYTSEGYVGLTPGELLQGDVVVFLFGSRIPTVLREQKLGGGLYKVVGPAILLGLPVGWSTQQALEKDSGKFVLC